MSSSLQMSAPRLRASAALITLWCASSAAMAFTAVTTNTNITEAEVKQAQEGWGKALVQISKDYSAGGISKARQTANMVLDAAYGYNGGVVLFKPTLTSGDHTFRTTRDGALSYFVGGDKNFPTDSGFALKGWEKYEIKNAGIYINGDLALTQGHVNLTDKDGKVTTVDKTWGFKKDEQGKLRIVLHHSSLPYTPAK